MRINAVKSQELNLVSPINVRGKLVDRISFTEITLDDFRHYQIQTLPNFHLVSHQDKLSAVLDRLEKTNDLKNFQALMELNRDLHPEVQFAYESILLNKYILKRPTYLSCKINELYSHQSSYYRVLKIKINPDFDLDLLQKLDEHLIFRLDGNRQFSAETLQKFLDKIPNHLLKRIEYIEEPCQNHLDSLKVLEKFHLKLAIDETLTENYQSINFQPALSYAVIKPSLIGLINSYQLISELYAKKITPIISSSYELNTGFNALIFLADHCNQLYQRELYHGLDTMKFFAPEFFDAKLKEDQISLFY